MIWMTGPLAQLIVSLIADLGVLSLILALPHTFMEIDSEIFSTVIILLALIGFCQLQALVLAWSTG